MINMKAIHFPSPVADDMVRAILEGRKTVTRRVVKPQPEVRAVPGEDGCYIYRGIPCGLDGMANIAPYRPRDILYVRETWAKPYGGMYRYRADYNEHDIVPADRGGVSVSANLIKWRPSIHMPREAVRVFLRVTDVRVERLQEITPEGAMKEGMIDPNNRPYIQYEEVGQLERYARNKVFRELWNSTIKPADRALYGWEANPWVWIIEFERCEKPEGA